MGVYGADGERRRFEYRLGRVERGGREGVQREHRAGAIPAELLCLLGVLTTSKRCCDVVYTSPKHTNITELQKEDLPPSS